MFTDLKRPVQPESETIVLFANLATLKKNATGAQHGDWCHVIDKGWIGRFETTTDTWYNAADGSVII